MKKLNLPLLLAAVIVSVVTAGGVFLLHRFQVSRNSGSIALQARQKRSAGEIDAAAGLFARYLALSRGDDDTFVEYAEMLLGEAAARRNSRPFLERTYAVAEEALRRKPTLDALRKRVAEFELAIGRATDAREHLLMVRSRLAPGGEPGDGPPAERSPQPTVEEVETLLARAELLLRNPELAAERLSRIVGYDLGRQSFSAEDRPSAGREPFVLLATTLRDQLGRQAAARDVIAELLRRCPDDPEAWLAACRFHLAAGELETAGSDIATARNLAPHDAAILFTAVDVRLAESKVAEAEALLAEARQSFPGDERLFAGLTELALRRNDLAAAEAALTEGVALLPSRPRLRLLLAEVLLRRGRTDACREAIAEAKRLVGDANRAVGLLECRLAVTEQRWTDARRMLEALRPLVAGNPGFTLQIDTLLAESCEQLGEVDEQLRISRRILLEDPTSIVARVIAAQALAAMGRLDEAGTEFESLAASIPADRLPSLPQIWMPLVQYRMLRAVRKPLGERDWSGVDTLLAGIEASETAVGPPAVLLRAEVLLRKGEPDAAVDLLSRAVAKGDDPRLLPALVTLVLRERGAEAAREVLQRAPADQPLDGDLLVARARVAAREPAAADEFAAVEAATARLPPRERAAVLTELAGLEARLGSAAEAERLLLLLAKERPADLRPRTSLFDLALSTGDVAAARRAADEIVALSGPKNPWARLAQAAVKILTVRDARQQPAEAKGRIAQAAQEKLLEEAGTLLLEAEADRPDWPPVQTMLAEVALLKDDTPTAITRLKRAVQSGLANPAVVRQLVSLLFAANRFSEIEAALESLGGENLQGLERFSAELEIRAGRLEEAVTLAERAVARDATDASDLIWLGQILDRSRQQKRAGDAFRRAVSLAPDRVDAWLALFSHELAAGNRTAAETTLGGLAEAIPDPRRQLALAQGYEMLGRSAEAESCLRAAAAAAPRDSSLTQALAAFLARAGRSEACREVLEGLLAADGDAAPDGRTTIWARRALAEILGNRGDYAGLREAIALIDRNAEASGRLSADDLALQIELLAKRPEPESWRRAVDLLGRLADKNPLSPPQRILQADLLERCGRWDEARGELLSLVATPNAPPAVVALLAAKLLDHRETAAARTWLNKARGTAPESAAVLVLELRLAMAEGTGAAATDLVGRLTAADFLARLSPGQLEAIAKALEEAGFADAADTVLDRLAAAGADGILARAEHAGRRHRPAEALDLLDRSRDSLPPERLLASAIAVAREQPDSGETTTRVGRWIDDARRDDRDGVVPALLEAEFRSLTGDESKAEDLYRSLLAREDIDPMQAAIAANNLAVLLSRPDTATEALAFADRAIAQLGPHPDLLDTRGVVRLFLGDARAALRDMRDAVLRPSDSKFLHLACVEHSSGDRPAAVTSLAEARRQGLGRTRLSPLDRRLLEALERDLGPTAAGRPDADDKAAPRLGPVEKS